MSIPPARFSGRPGVPVPFSAPVDDRSTTAEVSTSSTNDTPVDDRSTTAQVSTSSTNDTPADHRSTTAQVSTSSTNDTPADHRSTTAQVSTSSTNDTPAHHRSTTAQVSTSSTNGDGRFPVSALRVEKPHPLTPLVRAWVLVLAAVWAIGRELLGNTEGFRLPPLTWLTIGGGLVVLVLLVFAYLDWRATSFILDHGELRIETGVFTRSSQRIRFGRIQSVDITEPLGARLLGLAEIAIDVGAEGGHQVRYLSRARAAAMRDYLLARAHGLQQAELTQRVSTGVLDDLGEHDQVLVRVPPQRLLIGALLSHQFLLLTVPLLLLVAALIAFDPHGPEAVLSNPLLVIGATLPALGGLWSFVAQRVIGQWNYTFVRSGPGVKITRGLTSLSSQSVPRHRIQSLRIAQPLWWRGLDLFRVDLAVLGNHGLTTDEDGAGRTSILLPIGTRAEVELVLRTIWPGLALPAIAVQHSPERARWLQPLSQRWVAWGVDDSVLLTRSGWLTRTQHVVPHARIQSLALEQGPLARRLGLASVAIHTTQALTLIRARHLDPATARDLALSETLRARTSALRSLLSPR
ncbi:PH domain-containing protein [Micropruina sp.]|uniref:PH domain-containing protein n=1 Tax=Micropruina sp. TaxID=2737536 RepID=UPI0039E60F08